MFVKQRIVLFLFLLSLPMGPLATAFAQTVQSTPANPAPSTAVAPANRAPVVAAEPAPVGSEKEVTTLVVDKVQLEVTQKVPAKPDWK